MLCCGFFRGKIYFKNFFVVKKWIYKKYVIKLLMTSQIELKSYVRHSSQNLIHHISQSTSLKKTRTQFSSRRRQQNQQERTCSCSMKNKIEISHSIISTMSIPDRNLFSYNSIFFSSLTFMRNFCNIFFCCFLFLVDGITNSSTNSCWGEWRSDQNIPRKKDA